MKDFVGDMRVGDVYRCCFDNTLYRSLIRGRIVTLCQGSTVIVTWIEAASSRYATVHLYGSKGPCVFHCTQPRHFNESFVRVIEACENMAQE